MTTKPGDAQLAYHLIFPLQNSWITPNYLTTVRLLTAATISAPAFALWLIWQYRSFSQSEPAN